MKKTILSFVALCVGVFAMAQTSFYVYNNDGTTVEFAVAKVDSISFTKPAGSSDVLTGTFSVSADKRVRFSRGNLQCSGVTTGKYVWSFAENQYDMLGTANVSGGTEQSDATYGYSKSGDDIADKIDLFGWSANNETAKWGISTSTSYTDYSGDFADWGQNIGDGTTYRTLTYDEWDYLLDKRTNASKLKGVACIKLSDTQYVNGLILLPDSWDCPKDITFQIGFSGSFSIEAYATHQTFTIVQWQQLEAAGAVFLPASGYRGGSFVRNVQDFGCYWSASPYDSYYAYYLFFSSRGAYSNNYLRSLGRAVRLVQDLD